MTWQLNSRPIGYASIRRCSAWSTIGGNVATNAGGICCVKYGVTGDYVLGMQVVTGLGELVRLGAGRPQGSLATT